MRIERIEPSKHRKGRILVFLEDGACLKITQQELLDFGLRAGDELDDTMLTRLKETAGISNVKAAAADLVGKRAMSRASLEKKLQEKGASETEARYAAEWLEAIGAINDGEYAVLLAQHYARQGYGPARIRSKLYEKGVPKELWEEAMDSLPQDSDAIDRFLEGKLRGRSPDDKERKRLSDALLRRGFSWSQVREAWNRLDDHWSDTLFNSEE